MHLSVHAGKCCVEPEHKQSIIAFGFILMFFLQTPKVEERFWSGDVKETCALKDTNGGKERSEKRALNKIPF
jgi:hypothetical protein